MLGFSKQVSVPKLSTDNLSMPRGRLLTRSMSKKHTNVKILKFEIAHFLLELIVYDNFKMNHQIFIRALFVHHKYFF